MAGIEVNDFTEEIAFLESMFGSTVSAEVIGSVLESCDGNVHLAADAIMNFSDEMSTPSQEATESVDVRPVQVTSVLNVDAQPFEIQQPQTSKQQQSSTVNQQLENLNIQIRSTAKQDLPRTTSLLLPLPAARQISPTSVNYQPSPVARQNSPTAGNLQPPKETKEQASPSVKTTTLNQQPPSPAGPLSTAEAIPVSVYEAYRNSGALPKKPPDSNAQKPRYTMKNVWQDQVGKIMHYHNQGTRTLIIMRGVSGSGKTHLAKHIVDYTVGPSPQNYSKHIFSADNYFMIRGVYQYNRNSLSEAHSRNQRSVCEATNKGVSPVIVDNTNTELWEMESYIRDGVRNGYMIEFVEPNTSWATNVSQLEKRNTHGVPRETIRRMLQRFDKDITPESAIKAFRLTYSPNRKPPVLRNIPPFSPPESPQKSPTTLNIHKIENDNDQMRNVPRVEIPKIQESAPGEGNNVAINQVPGTEDCPGNVDEIHSDEHDIKLAKIIEAQIKLEQFAKVEQEWDNGESWDASTKGNNASSQSPVDGFGSVAADPKPPRGAENKDTEKLIEPSTNYEGDWAQFMPKWDDSNITNSGTTVVTSAQVESKSVGTGFEIEDMNEYKHAVLYGRPRDINEGIPEKCRPKIPKTIVLDKSTSTHDNDFLSKKYVCKNKEHHFREFRRMFKSVPRLALRDIFERCNCDVDWAANLMLQSNLENQRNMNSDAIVSDDEDDGPIEECNCLAGYNIVPDVTNIVEISPPTEPENIQNSTPTILKKQKRETKLSDDLVQLKRQIETNVIIPDSHYSQAHLNLRRRRENNMIGPERVSNPVSHIANTETLSQLNISGLDMSENATALPVATSNTYNYPTDFRDVAGPSTAGYKLNAMDAYSIDSDSETDDSDTESDSNKSDNLESTVTINMGPEFLGKLDELFGRKDFLYPDNIQPVVNLPISILQQINAHWAMSVAVQLDDGSRQSVAMINQDEEFARKLAEKEQNMSKEGKEPEVPTLREIMDMELAYSIYERGMAEWRNNEPQDLAAKLSREKLYNLFPDLPQKILAELLMAHEYNFKATIESLIISTGQSNWLEDEKGVEKFVMHKEMERKEKFLKEQNKNLDEAESSYSKDPAKPITLETVKYYRAEAEKWLQCRNANFEKARQYYSRNSPSAASFYSDIAALHTRKYEQSSCLAAACLMNYHLMNNPDNDVLDLHYLRVPEAMVNLDIFLDQVIQKLRAANIRFKNVWIITGKGLHSVSGPKIKPAAKKRFKARKILYKLINGGLMMAELHPTHKMTSELLEKN